MKNLKSRLPLVRGRYLFNVKLSRITWFRVGGIAQVTFKPADLEDLCFFLKNKPQDIPLHIIGVGSNLLVRDGGVKGVVIRLGQAFTNIHINGTTLDVGAATLDRTLATIACEEGITGLEFLCGIPGTIGGALRMNAGAYGSDISQILDSALVVSPQGMVHRLPLEKLNLEYRSCGLPKDWIFIGARLKGKKGNPGEIRERMTAFLKKREETQPIKSRTSGSTFANPEDCHAWELIDKAGCRGLEKGKAMISELHCNFMINKGGATAADLEDLGEEVRKRVHTMTGINLRWEIERIGERDPIELNLEEKAA